jgi:hypothetical protein
MVSKQITNYAKNLSVSDTTVNAQIKVNGKDSGIVHSFELTEDQFSLTSDKRFINYHTYYFVAIAYAYNNFQNFDPLNPVTTQDQPYIGSAHAAAGANILVVAAMPNPANGAMGTIINSDWGSGVVITRVEGTGNGGNVVELDSNSENAILQNDSVAKAVYKINQGPVDVKVVDPVKVPGYTWALQLIGPVTTTTGLADTSTWQLTAFDNNTKEATIYSEKDISSLNEQILEQYGISISLQQVLPPGYNQTTGDGYITSDVTFADGNKTWLWGVQTTPDSTFTNWVRSGYNEQYTQSLNPLTNPCNFNSGSSVVNLLDSFNNYTNLLADFTQTKGSWAPYDLAAAYASKHAGTGTQCGFEVAYSPKTQTYANFKALPDVDIVFTSDKNKWTRCAVVEEQEDPALAQGFSSTDLQSKFYLRRHPGWTGQSVSAAQPNTPLYDDDTANNGMSWFPGYAVDEGTGMRLNIVFGEDSYLGYDNGNDMIWNPSSNIFSLFDGSIIFGGKHVVYILGTKYDSDNVFVSTVRQANPSNTQLINAYAQMQWVGLPINNPAVPLLSLNDGIIPTQTRLRFRVNRPYAPYYAVADTSVNTLMGRAPGANPTNPYYTFTTSNLAPTLMSDSTNRKNLLSRVFAVPNPYYGYSGYEANRFDTKVRIINLPAQVTIYIYTLDGSLIRTLTKNDPNTPYIDWDIKNSAGLPIASGMYLMDVKAVGIGETVLKWFGAMRPIDATTY